MNRRERRAMYADAFGWRPMPFTQAELARATKTALLDGPDYQRDCRRYARRWRRQRMPGLRARARRIARQRAMQARRRLTGGGR